MNMDKPQEECGVFGIYSAAQCDVVKETFLALHALQHRGQESCGIAVSDDGVFRVQKDHGLVSQVFGQRALDALGRGMIALGHVRYAPGDELERANDQPLVIRYAKGSLAVAMNGALVNAYDIKNELQTGGAIFQTNSNAEVVSYVIARERLKTGSIEDAVQNAMDHLQGAYSMVIMSPHKLIAARDPHGFRPLCMGTVEGCPVFASESCAIESIGGEFIRDIRPGEVVVCDENGVRSFTKHCGGKSAFCLFEYIYFARPDSVIEQTSVHFARRRAGELLAGENPVAADMVCGVPDSGLDAALGYAAASGIPYGVALIKNKYVGRTFIQDTQLHREASVQVKLNVLKAAVAGKRIVLVDDSIVRGTTCRYIVGLLRKAGAKEIHLRVTAPPFRFPCFFGTDIRSKEHLIACRMSREEMTASVGADSIGFLSLENARRIAGNGVGLCDACFTGQYPIPVPEKLPTSKYEQKIIQLEVAPRNN
ncbi:MAG: amidophosphoribosyltransferase [Firmicutes bacterium]|nr:amidophosphoribosyltransferase [Bacillota bacterium]